jgi:hypothetical protein
MQESIAVVAQNALTYLEAVHPQIVRIFTPFGKRVPIEDCQTSPLIKQLIEMYEPKVKSHGLFQHQADFLRTFSQHPEHHFLLTTAAGLGKSLCFWAWVFDHLYRDNHATALLCFPTQALMWSQVERLTRLSEPSSLAFPRNEKTVAYGGTVKLMGQEIRWTVWYGHGEGYTLDELMDEHKNSDTFKLARIRVATIDKAHWSLIREHKEFVKRLRCIVLDEVHTYSGIFGANVHFFLKRLLMSQELLRRSGSKKPRFFLASATLSNTKEFVQKLLPLDGKDPNDEIQHIQDALKQEISLTTSEEVSHCLAQPPVDGLLRFVVLGRSDWDKLRSFIKRDDKLGAEANVILFSPSKFASRVMKLEMQHPDAKREVVIYDADLPPPQRRAIERKLNDPSVKGVTILATSAMELGVDIEGLDLCILPDVPPTKVELIQRIGRVGRRPGKPGLAIVLLGQNPRSERILEDPVEAFRLDQTEVIPLPTYLETLKLRHCLAALRDCRHRYPNDPKVDYYLLFIGLLRQFGSLPASQNTRELFVDLQSESKFWNDSRPRKLIECLENDLENAIKSSYSEAADMRDPDWLYKGFRGIDTYDIPFLLSEGAQDKEVARVNQMDVFRDAHPEAVYLGHDSSFYRVVAYEVTSRKSTLPLRWLKSIKAIRVEREERSVITRGDWQDEYEVLDCKTIPLRKGVNILRGTWTYIRQWQGYKEIDINQDREKFVSLGKVTKRFKQAMEEKADFPFLHPLTYRTLGWQWDFGPLEPDDATFTFILKRLLSGFIADSVESNEKDMIIDLIGHQLYVLDSTPGGNGLSFALLENNRFELALQRCMKKLSQFQSKAKQKDFEKYVSEMCYGVLPTHPVNVFLGAVQEIYNRWTGESKE